MSSGGRKGGGDSHLVGVDNLLVCSSRNFACLHLEGLLIIFSYFSIVYSVEKWDGGVTLTVGSVTEESNLSRIRHDT